MKPQLQFFIGKGGVGKSTTSALTSISLSQNSRDVLLVSMDPAHNQRDIFQQNFSEKPRQVAKRLAVKEVNLDYWIDKYLKETEKTSESDPHRIVAALMHYRWNQSTAACKLNWSRMTPLRKMTKYHIVENRPPLR